MKLLVKNNTSAALDSFILYLVHRIKQDILMNIDSSKYRAYDKAINEDGVVTFIGRKYDIRCVDILRQGVHNIEYKKLANGSYEVYINPDTVVYNSITPVYNIIKMIEYGTLVLKPILLFRRVFEIYGDRLQDAYNEYLNSEGV